jgi:hypothetical protein
LILCLSPAVRACSIHTLVISCNHSGIAHWPLLTQLYHSSSGAKWASVNVRSQVSWIQKIYVGFRVGFRVGTPVLTASLRQKYLPNRSQKYLPNRLSHFPPLSPTFPHFFIKKFGKWEIFINFRNILVIPVPQQGASQAAPSSQVRWMFGEKSGQSDIETVITLRQVSSLQTMQKGFFRSSGHAGRPR